MYKNFEADVFVQAIRNTSWLDVYCCEDVEDAVQKMSSKISVILNSMAPVKCIQVRSKYASWLSQKTKEKIKERDLAQQKAAETKNSDDWNSYKALRNSVNTILKTEKKQWQQNKLEEFGNDSGSVWKNLKSWLGWSKGGPPTKLMDNGNLCSKPKELVKIMNEFFVNKVKLLREKLPGNQGNSLDLVKKLMKNRKSKFKIKPVHPDEVLKIITNLKATQSCGTDDIDSKVIKLVKHELTPVITHIINLSIHQKTFPSQWKTAKVIPLHKKDEPIYPKNYRPVSLLPVFSKILEIAIFVQTADYFEKNDLVNPSHHGFRQKQP